MLSDIARVLDGMQEEIWELEDAIEKLRKENAELKDRLEQKVEA